MAPQFQPYRSMVLLHTVGGTNIARDAEQLKSHFIRKEVPKIRFRDQSFWSKQLNLKKTGGLGEHSFRMLAAYEQFGSYSTDAHAPHPAANLCVVASDTSLHKQEPSLLVACSYLLFARQVLVIQSTSQKSHYNCPLLASSYISLNALFERMK